MGQGDEESFGDFTAAQWPSLSRTALLLVGDRGHAEDLVQTTLVKVWAVWPRIRTEAPESYARRVLVNTVISWRRRHWHRERPAARLPDRATPGDVADSVSTRAALAAALSTLPTRQRSAVVLRFAEDLSEAETARAMGCSVGNVKALTSRGLATLRAAGLRHLVHEGTPRATGSLR